LRSELFCYVGDYSRMATALFFRPATAWGKSLAAVFLCWGQRELGYSQKVVGGPHQVGGQLGRADPEVHQQTVAFLHKGIKGVLQPGLIPIRVAHEPGLRVRCRADQKPLAILGEARDDRRESLDPAISGTASRPACRSRPVKWCMSTAPS